MASVPVLNKAGKKTDTVELPDDVFAGRVNESVLHQVIVMYQACQRQGTAATRERGSVSGGGIKPFRQKGTGRARAGSIRSPLWHGGGVVFGPHPRDFSYEVPQKMKRVALRESLNAKFQAQELICVEELSDKLAKTKEFAAILALWKTKGKVLALLDGCDESIRLVSRNIPRFQMVGAEDVNAFDILRNRTLVLTKTSLNKLLKRIQPKSARKRS